jgi:hypothetical protein
VISSDHLDPGAIGRVKATVATVNSSGPVLKHISIYSNDRITPVVSVEVALDIVPNDVVSKDTATKAAAPTNTAPIHTGPNSKI